MRTPPAHILLVEGPESQATLLRPLLASVDRLLLGPLSIAEAGQHCTTVLPEVAILDINPVNAPEVLTLARRLQHLGSRLIFVSTTADRALQAHIWRTQPVAVLPKPYRVQMLRQALALGLAPQTAASAHGQEPARPGASGTNLLFVREQQLLVRVRPADILCIERQGSQCRLWVRQGYYHTVNSSLAQLLHQLPAFAFARVHRTWAVQLCYIQAVAPTTGFIHLSHELKVPISRAYRQQLLNCLALPG